MALEDRTVLAVGGRGQSFSLRLQSELAQHFSVAQDQVTGCATYVSRGEFRHIMMAMDTRFGPDGLEYSMPEGDPEDMAALRNSYQHLTNLRDQTIDDGLLPPLDEWKDVNPNLV